METSAEVARRAHPGRDSSASTLAPLLGQTLLPGDEALDLRRLSSQSSSGSSSTTLRLGSGLRQDGSHVVALRSGVLHSAGQMKFWLESSLKRYTPAVDDEVVGIVVQKHAENFEVDIRGPCVATLPVLSFEGATRRNRPSLEIGSTVYARVVRVHPDADPELACVDASSRASGFGPLQGGFVLESTTGLARALLSQERAAVLEALSASVAFELAVGLNGRIWVKGETIQGTILVCNALRESEFKSPTQQRILVRALLQAGMNREK